MAAAPGGTIITIEGNFVRAHRPDGGASHTIGEGSTVSSVSMSNDGIIYIADDENYVDTDDTMWAFTQGGSYLGSWAAPNPGEGELYGGISGSEIRRDGERIMTASTWSNCTGGGLSDICSVQYVTEPGSTEPFGTLTNRGTTHWLGNTDTMILDGGQSYWKVGDDDKSDWFEDADLFGQWDADAATTMV